MICNFVHKYLFASCVLYGPGGISTCICLCSVISPIEFNMRSFDIWGGNSHFHLTYPTFSLLSCFCPRARERGLSLIWHFVFGLLRDMPNDCIFLAKISDCDEKNSHINIYRVIIWLWCFYYECHCRLIFGMGHRVPLLYTHARMRAHTHTYISHTRSFDFQIKKFCFFIPIKVWVITMSQV